MTIDSIAAFFITLIDCTNDCNVIYSKIILSVIVDF